MMFPVAIAATRASTVQRSAGSKPISTLVPPISMPLDPEGERWIEIDLSHQTLTAYRGNEKVRTMPISSGVSPRWTTPNGIFWVYRKVADDRMQGEDPQTGERWDVAHVPWAQYFEGGIAIHGAWWNRHFGIPSSHGCIQLPTRTFNPDPGDTPEDAAWLYRFTRVGTAVKIVGTTPVLKKRQPLAYPALKPLPTSATSDASSTR